MKGPSADQPENRPLPRFRASRGAAATTRHSFRTRNREDRPLRMRDSSITSKEAGAHRTVGSRARLHRVTEVRSSVNEAFVQIYVDDKGARLLLDKLTAAAIRRRGCGWLKDKFACRGRSPRKMVDVRRSEREAESG